MDQRNTIATNGRQWRALSGVLFAACFIAGGILDGALAPVPLPLPGAPAAEVARYFQESRTAALAVGAVQVVSALALLVFAGCVVAFVRRASGEGGALPRLTSAGGILAVSFLLVSALLTLALVPVAAGGDLGLVGGLRSLNFLTGGTLHVASLGLLVGAASVVARRARALPGWIAWLGIVAAVPAILSLASLAWFPASVLILLGRLLAFVWSIAVGIALALGGPRRHAAAERGDRRVLA